MTSRRKPARIYTFRLYVAGGTLNSAQAIANLNALCHERLADHHEIEIVDVFREPARALADHVCMTPTLIKLSPAPMCRIVGTLSHTEPLLMALGLSLGAQAA